MHQEIHEGLLESLGLASNLLADLWEQLLAHLKANLPLEEKLDRVMGWGERLSARVMAAACARAAGEAQIFPSRLGLVSNDRFQDASILESSLEPIAQKIFQLRGLPVVPGYVGVTADRPSTTLGRSSSNYTAAVVGTALKREVEIFTDVDGVATTNPNFLPRPFRKRDIPTPFLGCPMRGLSDGRLRQQSALSKVSGRRRHGFAQGAPLALDGQKYVQSRTFRTVLQGHHSAAGVPKGITALEGVPVLTVYLDREDDYRPLWRMVEELPGVHLLMASYSSSRASFVLIGAPPKCSN